MAWICRLELATHQVTFNVFCYVLLHARPVCYLLECFIQDLDRAQTARTLSSAHCRSLNQTQPPSNHDCNRCPRHISVRQGTSPVGREISLKLFRTLKQRHQGLPHVAKHSCFPLSPWSTNMTTSKIICALDIRWNNRHLSHYFFIVPDLPHDIYIGVDIMVRLNACIDTVNYIIWAPLSHQLTTSVNLKNLQSGQTMPDACAMITEQEATIPAYIKSVSVRLN